uniref:Uncharacterized protein n=1 Tax=Rousettus aegyptiacus TaxID=9407 RepID=A0A7J8DHQ5_ROUAE|nr:hypothetical protein HJG63_008503 [Rousettus aegyptiacus]
MPGRSLQLDRLPAVPGCCCCCCFSLSLFWGSFFLLLQGSVGNAPAPSPRQSLGNLQPLIYDLMNYFIRQGEVTFGSQMYANKDCDRTTYDLKLEVCVGGGWVTPHHPPRQLESLVNLDPLKL